MGRAPAVLGLLGRRRVTAFAVLGAAVGAYYAVFTHLPNVSHNWDIALLVVAIMPAVLALLLPLLPLWQARPALLFAAFAVFGVAAIVFELLHEHRLSTFAKLFCFAFFGWFALAFFEELWWAVLIAFVVPIADSISVFWRHGITHNVTAKHFGTYLAVAVAFVVPGLNDRGEVAAAQIGPPDVIFFALFLAAADRFRLRVAATFAAMTLLLGLTIVLATVIGIEGMPALVPLSLGFLGTNVDLIWHRFRAAPAAE